MDLFATSKQTNLLPCDGEVIHWGFLYDLATCGELFEELRHTIDWQNDVLVIFGKKIVTTRKVAWYGDNNLQYSYSNTIKTALPWTETLDKIKADVFKLSGLRFNSCLLNLYPSGMEGMGWHSDDEPELGENPVIASLSLGATRKFKFRHKL